MADNTILVPGSSGSECVNPTNEVIDTSQFLTIDGHLGEFKTESDKDIARINIRAAGVDDVYDKASADNRIQQAVKQSMDTHLATDDPHNILPQIEGKFEGLVKQDGTMPFTAPQTGVNPVSDFHLTTKRFVTDLLNSHLAKTDPHNIIPLVEEILKVYVTVDQIYKKAELYTKSEVDKLVNNCIKSDGSVAFLRPQLGVTPKADNHLSTKKYVDDVMFNHLVDADPHGFLSLLNQRLNNYFKKSETYSRAETYSRNQIDAIINQLVADAAKGAVEEHVNQYDPHGTLKEIYSKHYVQRDGTVPFTAPQKGVEGTEEDDLVVMSQLNKLKEEIGESVDKLQPIWITSGPVQTTVGFVEDETELSREVTFQEIMDAIFYGQAVDVKSPPTCIMGDTVKVEMYIRGLLTIQYAELYQNGELIGTFTSDDFETGMHVVNSLPIYEDTEFKFVVTLLNGVQYEASSITKVSLHVFVGLLPKWYVASNVTFEYLQELVNDDPINNKFESFGDDVTEIKHKYEFSSPKELKHLFVAIPKDYNDLIGVVTPAQEFGIEAFDVISDIPFKVPGAPEDVIYKLYVYREALAMLNSEVTFKFEE